MLTRFSRRTLFAFLALTLLLVGASLLAEPAEAALGGCLRSEAITTYYSNATRSTVVGWCISGCTGGCRCTGIGSAYYTIDHLYCTD